jgi:hypothetical protein
VRSMPALPFRVFRSAARTAVLPPWFVLPGLAARSEYSPFRYRRYWLDDPTVPLAISPALWFSLSQLRGATVK